MEQILLLLGFVRSLEIQTLRGTFSEFESLFHIYALGLVKGVTFGCGTYSVYEVSILDFWITGREFFPLRVIFSNCSI